MKKLILLLFIPLVSFSQDELLNTFKTDLEATMNYTNERNWDKVIDYTYPEMFNYVTKEQMIGVFESLSSSGIEMKTSNLTNLSVSEEIEFNGAIFYRIDFKNNLTIKLSEEILNYEETILDNLINFYKTRVDDFNFDEDTNTLYLSGNRVITVARKTQLETDDWKYLEINETSPLLEAILPLFVREKFKLPTNRITN